MEEREIMTVKQVAEPRPFKMYYVYLLKNIKKGNIYIGWTTNLKRRYNEHKEKDSNWQIVYYKAYISNEDTRLRKKQLKQYGSALGNLKIRIKNCLRKGGVAGQWRFKKDVIDKWISEESLERVTQNIKSSKKGKTK
jgi:predicted GIY-YIG superfamily endonuclease